MKASLAPAVAALLCAAAGAQNQTLRAPWIGYAVTQYPHLNTRQMVVGDFDGDNVPDVVATCDTNPQLSFLRGDGSAGFAQPIAIDMGDVAWDLAAGDVDGDGLLDVVAANPGSYGPKGITFFRNNGGGAFTQLAFYDTTGSARSVELFDFDGDTDLDVAVTIPGTGATSFVSLRLNDGAGNFGAQGLLVLTSGADAIVRGDLDGDGAMDLVVGHETNRVSVLRNNGIWFDPPVAYTTPVAGFLDGRPAVAVGDADGDGDLDVFYSSSAMGLAPGGGNVGTVVLLPNVGATSLGAPVEIPLASASDGASDLALADVDGDSDLDLIAGADRSWTLVTNDGSGAFGSPQAWRAAGSTLAVAAEDLDGDGLPEVLALSQDPMELVVHRNTQGGFAAELGATDLETSSATSASSNLEAADVDLDGDVDVAFGWGASFSGAYGINVSLGDGTGAFGAPTSYPATSFPRAIELADVDGDSYPDLLWLDEQSRLRLRMNRQNGTFQPTQTLPGTYCFDDGEVRAFDVDLDSDLDVLVADCGNKVQVLLNQGGGTFAAPLSHSVGGNPTALGGGDLNGDTVFDLLTNTGSQSWLELSLGNNDGTFQPPTLLQTGRGARAIEVRDMDGDGRLDVVSAHSLDGSGASVVFSNGFGFFGAPVLLDKSYSGDADDVDTFDFDGDGNLDVVAPNRVSNDVSVWISNGDRTFQPQRRFGVGPTPAEIEVADVDGDGSDDLLLGVQTNSFGAWYYSSLAVLEGGWEPWAVLAGALDGSNGTPALAGVGSLAPATTATFVFTNGPSTTFGWLVIGAAQWNLPLFGGVLVPSPDYLFPFATDPLGDGFMSLTWPPNVPSGASIVFQAWLLDPTNPPDGFCATNGLLATQP